MSDIGNMMARALMVYTIIGASIAFSAGALAVWGLPKLWHALKPALHALTG
jgi:hypothetical protein